MVGAPFQWLKLRACHMLCQRDNSRSSWPQAIEVRLTPLPPERRPRPRSVMRTRVSGESVTFYYSEAPTSIEYAVIRTLALYLLRGPFRGSPLYIPAARTGLLQD